MSYYSGASLGELMKEKSSSSSYLTSSGGLTPSHQSMCEALGDAIATIHNQWQQSALLSNVSVTGGTSAVQGAISSASGLASPGTIIGRMSGTGSECVSRFPTSEMTALTPALRSYVSSIGSAFEELFNQFLDQALISNIIVDGGFCTCNIISGVPIPGTLIGAIGRLDSLSSGTSSLSITSGLIRQSAISKMDSNILVQGVPTTALDASLNGICQSLAETHSFWIENTNIENLVCNGGVTLPNGPVVGAVGNSGIFV